MTAVLDRDRLSGGVALLYGGRSAEREISLQSGAAVQAALQRLQLPVIAIDTAEKGWLQRWPATCEYAFIALHGPGGEDGTVQGALDQLGVTYTGSGVLASALAMDKLRSKQLWRGIGLPTPDFAVLDASADCDALMAEFGAAFVKPAHEGSSIGMARVTSAAELRAAYSEAGRFDASVLVERAVTGAEYTVAILGDRALPVIRVETDRGFYDFEAKYRANTTRYLCPCGLTADREQQVAALALAAFRSLGCTGWARADVMVDADGQLQLLEINTVPGMTDHSLVPMAAAAAGLGFDQLVAEILQLALDKAAVDAPSRPAPGGEA